MGIQTREHRFGGRKGAIRRPLTARSSSGPRQLVTKYVHSPLLPSHPGVQAPMVVSGLASTAMPKLPRLEGHKKSGSSLAWLSRSKSIITGGPPSASASSVSMSPSGSSDGSSSTNLEVGVKLTKVKSDAGRERERDKERGKEAVGMLRDLTSFPKVILGAVKDDWPLYRFVMGFARLVRPGSGGELKLILATAVARKTTRSENR